MICFSISGRRGVSEEVSAEERGQFFQQFCLSWRKFEDSELKKYACSFRNSFWISMGRGQPLGLFQRSIFHRRRSGSNVPLFWARVSYPMKNEFALAQEARNWFHSSLQCFPALKRKVSTFKTNLVCKLKKAHSEYILTHHRNFLPSPELSPRKQPWPWGSYHKY